MIKNQSDYSTTLAREHAYQHYLCALTLPADSRKRVLAILALDAELRMVAAKVREEMIAHIRYAWWREALEALAQGKAPREHPLLQSLAALKMDMAALLPIVDAVQECWPAHEHHPSASALAACAREAGEAWEKPARIASAHLKNHGHTKRPWLALKLLLFSR